MWDSNYPFRPAPVTKRVFQPRGINILQLLFWKHFQSFADQYEEKHAIIYGRFRILIKITPSQRRYARSCAIR